MRGEGVPVGNEEIAIVFLLHFHETTDSAIVVAKMKVAGGPDAAQNDVFVHILWN